MLRVTSVWTSTFKRTSGNPLLWTFSINFIHLTSSSRIQKTIKMASQVRQNYHEDCEASINKQINMELYASYVYLSMVSRYCFGILSVPPFSPGRSRKILWWMILCLNNLGMIRIMMFRNRNRGRKMCRKYAIRNTRLGNRL